MSARILTPLLVLFLCVGGCKTLSADPRLVGTYAALGSENLIFERDASVFHSRMEPGRERRVFLGFASRTRHGSTGELSISGPDTSPFLGTTLDVSPDFSRVKVHWESVPHLNYAPQETEFKRTPNG